MTEPLRVAVVGAGFAGAATAAALLRTVHGVRVHLLDRTGVFGRGVAYSTPSPEHLLNVPAGRMSALPAEPEHFVGWARRAGLGVTCESFVPRSVYGDYVQDVLARAERAAGPGALERIAEEATEVEAQPGRPPAVHTARRRIEADAVVLALGVSRPETPGYAAAVLGHDAYHDDPWDQERIAGLRDAREVLVLGTGMTMVDVALTLGGGAGGRGITAISRRGELPRAHRAGGSCDTPEPVVRPGPGLTADGLAARVLDAARRTGDWRAAVDSLRPVTPELWRSLPREEQRRFVDRYARRWEVHRSRTAPEAAARIAALRAAGTLRVEATAIRALRPVPGGRIAADLDGGGVLEADAVVNAAGPTWDCRRGDHALLRELIERGIAAPGPLGLGLRTDPGGALVDRAGRPSSALFTLGALRRGELWETVAVPELSAQACALAERVATMAPALAA